ncbi:MAG: hypothetical protein CVU46_01005 [Chloroflexi bacterium HGW-Chloroflexi-8]|nr:MAG: hypothetical protein CVU46_01005 [Chloroflexi bacterium HGW-Chloroflexi-8]
MCTRVSNRILEFVVVCHQRCTASYHPMVFVKLTTANKNIDVQSFIAFIKWTQARKKECKK